MVILQREQVHKQKKVEQLDFEANAIIGAFFSSRVGERRSRDVRSRHRKTAVSHRPESERTWMWPPKTEAAPERREKGAWAPRGRRVPQRRPGPKSSAIVGQTGSRVVQRRSPWPMPPQRAQACALAHEELQSLLP